MGSSSTGSSSEEAFRRTPRKGVAGEKAVGREFWERYWDVLRVKGGEGGA